MWVGYIFLLDAHKLGAILSHSVFAQGLFDMWTKRNRTTYLVINGRLALTTKDTAAPNSFSSQEQQVLDIIRNRQLLIASLNRMVAIF